MNICILGNSHTGALKRAWDYYPVPSIKNKFKITFFASRGFALQHLKLEDKKLVPQNKVLEKNLKFTSNGESFIDLMHFDVFLLYGINTKAFYKSEQSYSKAVLSRAIHDTYSQTISYQILLSIRKAVPNKIYLGHTPLPSNKQRDNTHKIDSLENRYYTGLSFANKQIFSPINAELLEQPKETMTGNCFNTLSTYSKNSKRLDVGDKYGNVKHDEEDRFHMNDDFGMLWLKSFFKKLQADKIELC